MHKYTNKSKGFTIVELLIVVVVIAILAAITIVAFNGVKDKAVTASTKTDLSQNAKTLEQYYVINGELYPTNATVGGLSASSGSSLSYYPAPDFKSYCLQVVNGNTVFRTSNTELTPVEGLCGTIVPTVGSLTSTSLNLSWTAVADATSYNSRCATNSTYTTGLISRNTATSPASFTGMTAGTTYYCDVQAVLGVTASPFSPDVTTATSAPAVPTGQVATGQTTTSFTFSWTAVAGAIGYTAQCSANSGYTTFVHNTSPAGTSVSVTGLTAATTYYCKALARGTSTNSAYATSITTASSNPAVPTGLASSALTSTTFTFAWAASSGAIGYTAQCASDAGFTVLVHNSSPAGTSVPVTGLTAATTYYCRALTRGTNANSAYATAITVVTP